MGLIPRFTIEIALRALFLILLMVPVITNSSNSMIDNRTHLDNLNVMNDDNIFIILYVIRENRSEYFRKMFEVLFKSEKIAFKNCL